MPPTEAEVRTILRSARRIAVVGLSPKTHRPSHSVAAYLQRAGYEILPVHPAGGTILGQPVYPDVASAGATGPIDIVNVFRRSEAIPTLVEPCVSLRPRLVWMQVGVVHREAAERIEAAGIPVVMDRCLAVAHQSLGAG